MRLHSSVSVAAAYLNECAWVCSLYRICSSMWWRESLFFMYYPHRTLVRESLHAFVVYTALLFSDWLTPVPINTVRVERGPAWPSCLSSFRLLCNDNLAPKMTLSDYIYRHLMSKFLGWDTQKPQTFQGSLKIDKEEALKLGQLTAWGLWTHHLQIILQSSSLSYPHWGNLNFWEITKGRSPLTKNWLVIA